MRSFFHFKWLSDSLAINAKSSPFITYIGKEFNTRSEYVPLKESNRNIIINMRWIRTCWNTFNTYLSLGFYIFGKSMSLLQSRFFILLNIIIVLEHSQHLVFTLQFKLHYLKSLLQILKFGFHSMLIFLWYLPQSPQFSIFGLSCLIDFIKFMNPCFLI